MVTVADRVRSGRSVPVELRLPRSPESEAALEVWATLGWDTARTP